MKAEREIRSFPFEIRQENGSDDVMLVGYAVRWNERSEPLPFSEAFMPGAFTKSLERGDDILALVGHNLSHVIGRRSNGTLTVTEDEIGLKVESKPNTDTTHGRDIVALIKRGDVKHMSVGFRTINDRWEEAGDMLLRDIIEAELVEVSTASLPAYRSTNIQPREEKRDMKDEIKRIEAAAEVAVEEPVQEETRQEEHVEERREVRRIDPVLATPLETRSAFANYLRGREFDTRTMKLDPGTSGGYVAPEEFVAELIKALNAASVMRQVADVKGPIAAASVRFPVLTSSVTATWTAEGAAIDASDAVFDQIEFTPHKLAALTMASNELIGDAAINVEQLLAELFGEEFAKVEDAAFFGGSGSGQPSGILGNDDIETVEAAGADTITADDIMSVYDKLPVQYRAGAVWIMHPSTMGVLRQIKDDAGNYLVVRGLTEAAPTTLLGRPVYLSENMPEIESGAKTLLFGDLKRAYRIVDRQGIDVQRSGDRYFEQDLTAFRAIKRTDGKVILPEAAVFLVQA